MKQICRYHKMRKILKLRSKWNLNVILSKWANYNQVNLVHSDISAIIPSIAMPVVNSVRACVYVFVNVHMYMDILLLWTAVNWGILLVSVIFNPHWRTAALNYVQWRDFFKIYWRTQIYFYKLTWPDFLFFPLDVRRQRKNDNLKFSYHVCLRVQFYIY